MQNITKTYPASDRCRQVGHPQKPSPPSTTIFFAAPADIDTPSTLPTGDWACGPATLDHDATEMPDTTEVRVEAGARPLAKVEVCTNALLVLSSVVATESSAV